VKKINKFPEIFRGKFPEIPNSQPYLGTKPPEADDILSKTSSTETSDNICSTKSTLHFQEGVEAQMPLYPMPAGTHAYAVKVIWACEG